MTYKEAWKKLEDELLDRVSQYGLLLGVPMDTETLVKLNMEVSILKGILHLMDGLEFNIEDSGEKRDV